MFHAAFRQTRSKIFAGHGFNFMRLIQNHMGVVGKKSATARAHGQVAEEQRMVAHQNIRVLHAPPRRLIEALVIRWTALAHAIVRIALHLLPNRFWPKHWQRRQCSVTRLDRPILHRVQLVALFLIGKESLLTLAGQTQSPQTDVISTSFG